ncbi:MAG: hypothetical protein ACLFNO_04020 [Parcubacteria group bacterium]
MSNLNPDLYVVKCNSCKKEFFAPGFADEISGGIDDTLCPACNEPNYLGDKKTDKTFLGTIVKPEKIKKEIKSAESAREVDSSSWREGYIIGLNKALNIIEGD